MAAMAGASAREFTLADTDGRQRSLLEFHRLGPVALLFLPTVFGLRPRWQFWSLLRHYDQFVRNSTEILVLAADPLPELRIFQIREGYPFVFLFDRDRAVAKEYELGVGAAAAMLINVQGIIGFAHRSRRGLRCSAARLLRALAELPASERVP